MYRGGEVETTGNRGKYRGICRVRVLRRTVAVGVGGGACVCDAVCRCLFLRFYVCESAMNGSYVCAVDWGVGGSSSPAFAVPSSAALLRRPFLHVVLGGSGAVRCIASSVGAACVVVETVRWCGDMCTKTGV